MDSLWAWMYRIATSNAIIMKTGPFDECFDGLMCTATKKTNKRTHTQTNKET